MLISVIGLIMWLSGLCLVCIISWVRVVLVCSGFLCMLIFMMCCVRS